MKRLKRFFEMVDLTVKEIEGVVDSAVATSPTKEKGGYYKLKSGAECIDLVDDVWDRENLPGRVRGYFSNAVEYLWRCGKKPGIDWREDAFKAANELFRAVTGSWLTQEQKTAFFALYGVEKGGCGK